MQHIHAMAAELADDLCQGLFALRINGCGYFNCCKMSVFVGKSKNCALVHDEMNFLRKRKNAKNTSFMRCPKA
jgi:hypothetical protein